MALPVIPNTFSSGTTFIASEVSENNIYIVDALKEGIWDLTLKNIECVNSANIASEISFNTGIFSGSIAVASDISLTSDIDFNRNIVSKKINFGLYEEVSIEDLAIIAKSSYISINDIGSVTHMSSWKNSPTSPVIEMPKETIVVITLHPSASGTVVIYNGYELSDTYYYGFRLETSTVTLSSVHDKLVVQLTKDAYTGLYYWQQISFQDNA